MRKMTWVLAIVTAACGFGAETPPDVSNFEARVHKEPDGSTLQYRLLIPKDYVAGQSRPLVIWLHGSGEKGTDNVRQVKYLPKSFLGGSPESPFPAFVLVPQCPPTGRWVAMGYNAPADTTPLTRMLIATLVELKTEFNLDDRRISVGGFSMGGYAVWELLARYPNAFAAAFPVAGLPNNRPGIAAWVKDTPIWMFHGEKDPAVPIADGRKIVAEIKALDGKIKFTEIPGGGHDCTHALAEPELPQWLLAQKRSEAANFSPTVLPAGIALVNKTIANGTHGSWNAKAARFRGDLRFKIDTVNYQVKLDDKAEATVAETLAKITKPEFKTDVDVTGIVRIDTVPWIIVEKIVIKE